jgi:hypothetical protein
MNFFEKPQCCVELSPEHFSSVPEALRAARDLGLAVAHRERVPA